jgi:hypothetical protein
MASALKFSADLAIRIAVSLSQSHEPSLESGADLQAETQKEMNRRKQR